MSRIGLVLAVAAAVWFTEGGLRGAVVGSLLLGAVLVTDPVADRLRGGRRDRLDVWLALVLGRLREYVVYVGLAVGGTAAGVPDAWAWAAGALIALALRDSVAAARRADVGRPEWTPESGLPRPIEAVDPSRRPDDSAPGDASLTAELLGAPEQSADATADTVADGDGDGDASDGDASGGAASAAPGDGLLFGIRTVPKGAPWPGWSEGRADALGAASSADDRETPGGPALPSDTADTGTGPPVPGPRPSFRTWLAAFPQAARFGVVALTITIWDARVTFVALIVGCVLAVTAELTGRPDDTTR
ncbi:hypothetical protein [Streptomonospora alba]|uniref:hypothetical protein n=1 Tax=Streptomonospora alba TaxID=183763 RepID=UPI00069959EC|nr:hypothetical protein [Streptomonospora alba]